MLKLPQRGRQVLGADLNCSESKQYRRRPFKKGAGPDEDRLEPLAINDFEDGVDLSTRVGLKTRLWTPMARAAASTCFN
jgi:hypothetical protein